jgi:tRNA 2-thiouridine synthesizing protein C
MFVNRKAPYGTIYALESLEVVLITATFDQDVSLVFIDDGVYELVKGQDTKGIGIKNHSKTYRALDGYDVEKLYVERESMEERGLTEADLLVDVEVLSSAEMAALMAEQDVVLVLRQALTCCTSSTSHPRRPTRCRVACAWHKPGSHAAADRGRIYAAATGCRHRPRLAEALARLKVCVLQPDVQARGMAGRLIEGVHVGRLRRLRRPGGRAHQQPDLALRPPPQSPKETTPWASKSTAPPTKPTKRATSSTSPTGTRHRQRDRQGRERRDDGATGKW